MNEYLIKFFKKLETIFHNPELELRILINRSSYSQKEIILSNFKINMIDISKFEESFRRRIKGEPISKIYNSKSFWKYNFFVNNDVLDPRPETELIIEEILKYYRDNQIKLKILDMCTGSGCIAISIAKEFINAQVVATDISSKAIKVAKLNAKNLNCINQITFIKCDLINKMDKFDIVIANPPYLSNEEYNNTSNEIKLYEPKIALLAPENG